MQLLQWAVANGCPYDSGLCERAAEEGHTDVLRWAHIDAVRIYPRFIRYASALKLPVLVWARQHNFEWDEHTLRAVAAGGCLDAMRYARENGCPWSDQACGVAALGGHLEMLQWLRENGCPWSESTCVRAVQGGHMKVLEWAYRNGCPCVGSKSLYFEAGSRGRSDIVSWLVRTAGVDMRRACVYAARFDHLNLLKLFVDNGWAFDVEACTRKAKNQGHKWTFCYCKALALRQAQKDGSHA